MSHSLILLVPLLALAAVALFAFAGCGLTVVGKAPDPGTGTGPGPETTYEDAVKKTAGLVAYWRLGEAKLPADPYPPAADEGPNKLTGSYHGPVVLSNVPGALAKKEPGDKAPDFNGDGYVEVPFSAALNNFPFSFSVECWIQPGMLTSPGTEQHVVAFRDVAGPVNRGFEINVVRTTSQSRIQGRCCTGGGAAQAIEAYLELDDAKLGPASDWFHVVVTYDGAAKSLILYVNTDAGGPNQKQANVQYGPNTQQPLRIGAGRAAAAPAPAQFYVGGIDEVAVYNVALDQNAVNTHYHLSGR